MRKKEEKRLTIRDLGVHFKRTDDDYLTICGSRILHKYTTNPRDVTCMHCFNELSWVKAKRVVSPLLKEFRSINLSDHFADGRQAPFPPIYPVQCDLPEPPTSCFCPEGGWDIPERGEYQSGIEDPYTSSIGHVLEDGFNMESFIET